MLKTWQLKQFGVYRREIAQQIMQGVKSGDKKRIAGGLASFAYLLLAGVALNASVSLINSLISGADPDPEDIAADSALKLIGANRYGMEKIQNIGPVKGLIQIYGPAQPLIIVDDLYKALTMDDKELRNRKLIGQIPVIGKIYERRLANEDKRQKEWKKRLKELGLD
jgi:hypothetical protein